MCVACCVLFDGCSLFVVVCCSLLGVRCYSFVVYC